MLARGQKPSIKGRGIQSIEVGSRILAVLADAENSLMLRDIAAKADLTPAQAHAYLASFKRIELVDQDSASGRYLLGPAAIRLAIARFRGSEVMRAANREAKILSQDLGLMVTILVWGPHAPTVVFVHEVAESLEVNIRAGTRFSVAHSPCGRVFAAFDNQDSVRSRITKEISEIGETSGQKGAQKKSLEKTIAQIRANGYEWQQNNPVPGLSSAAAPVMSSTEALDIVVMLVGTNDKLAGEPTAEPISRLLAMTRRLTELGRVHGSATASQ